MAKFVTTEHKATGKSKRLLNVYEPPLICRACELQLDGPCVSSGIGLTTVSLVCGNFETNWG